MTTTEHEALKAARMRLGLTQREVAELLGITPAYMHDLENGRRRLSDEKIIQMPHNALRLALIASRIAEYRTRIERLQQGQAPKGK